MNLTWFQFGFIREQQEKNTSWECLYTYENDEIFTDVISDRILITWGLFLLVVL